MSQHVGNDFVIAVIVAAIFGLAMFVGMLGTLTGWKL